MNNKNNKKDEIKKLSESEEKEVAKTDEDKYFKSKKHRYIFALIELDGQSRATILGITKELYNDKDKAKKWRTNLTKLIHPDVCDIDGAETAMAKINDMYERMIENE